MTEYNFEFNLEKEVRTTKNVNSKVKKKVSISLPLVTLKNKNLAHLIPKENPYYVFDSYAYDIICDIKENRNVALTGHTGCGKTSVILEIAARIGQPVLRVNLNDDSMASQFMGRYLVKDGATVWVDGSLILAMKEDLWLVFDEADYSNQDFLCRFNGVFEPVKTIIIQEKDNEMVVAKPNFRVFATGNTLGKMLRFRHLYPGTRALNPALLSRFRLYHVPYLNPESEEKMLANVFLDFVCKNYPNLTLNKNNKEILKIKNHFLDKDSGMMKLIKIMVEIANNTREHFFMGEMGNFLLSTRLLMDWAEATIRHECPFEGARVSFYGSIDEDNVSMLDNFIKNSMLLNEEIENIFSQFKKSITKATLERTNKNTEVLFVVDIIKNIMREVKINEGKTEEEINSFFENSTKHNNLINSSFLFVTIRDHLIDLYEDNKIKYEFSKEDLALYVQELIRTKKFNTIEGKISTLQQLLDKKVNNHEWDIIDQYLRINLVSK